MGNLALSVDAPAACPRWNIPQMDPPGCRIRRPGEGPTQRARLLRRAGRALELSPVSGGGLQRVAAHVRSRGLSGGHLRRMARLKIAAPRPATVPGGRRVQRPETGAT